MEIRLKEVREGKGYTIRELSKKSRVSVGHISSIENGLRIPSIEVMCKLAKALGCRVTDLVICE